MASERKFDITTSKDNLEYGNLIFEELSALHHEYITGNQERFKGHPALLRVIDDTERNNGSAFLYEYRGVKWIILTTHQVKNSLSSSPDFIFSTQDNKRLTGTHVIRLGLMREGKDISIAISDKYPGNLEFIQGFHTTSSIVSSYGYPLNRNRATKYTFLNPPPSGNSPVISSGIVKRNIGNKEIEGYDQFQTDFINTGNSGGPVISSDGKNLVGMIHGSYFHDNGKFAGTALIVPARVINGVLDTFLEYLEKNTGKPFTQNNIYEYAKVYEKHHQEIDKTINTDSFAKTSRSITKAYKVGDFISLNSIVKGLIESNQLPLFYAVADRSYYAILSSAVAGGDRILFQKLISLLNHAKLYSIGTDNIVIGPTYERYKYLGDNYWEDFCKIERILYQARKMNIKYETPYFHSQISNALKKDKTGMLYLQWLLPS